MPRLRRGCAVPRPTAPFQPSAERVRESVIATFPGGFPRRCKRTPTGSGSPNVFDGFLRLGQAGTGDLAVLLDRRDDIAGAGKVDHGRRQAGGIGLVEGDVALGEQRLELLLEAIATGHG